MRSIKPGFAFNDTWSMTQAVELLEPPRIPRASRRGQGVIVPGRSGNLWLDDDSYDNIQFDLKCRAKKGACPSEIAAWLTGSGDLTFSQSPEFCYRARLTAELQFDAFLPGRTPHNFTLKCDCQPFRYRSTPDVIQLTAPDIMRNPGTRRSRPVITLYGTGNITLTVGTNIIQLSGLVGGIVLDSEMDEAYWGNQSMNSQMSGAFPRFGLAKTPISWTGNVARLVIRPNWRWL